MTPKISGPLYIFVMGKSMHVDGSQQVRASA